MELRYGVSYVKDGGPTFKDLRGLAEDEGIKIYCGPSCYVGHRTVYLVKGSKRKFEKLLNNFGINFLI